MPTLSEPRGEHPSTYFVSETLKVKQNRTSNAQTEAGTM